MDVIYLLVEECLIRIVNLQLKHYSVITVHLLQVFGLLFMIKSSDLWQIDITPGTDVVLTHLCAPVCFSPTKCHIMTSRVLLALIVVLP